MNARHYNNVYEYIAAVNDIPVSQKLERGTIDILAIDMDVMLHETFVEVFSNTPRKNIHQYSPTHHTMDEATQNIVYMCNLLIYRIIDLSLYIRPKVLIMAFDGLLSQDMINKKRNDNYIITRGSNYPIDHNILLPGSETMFALNILILIREYIHV